MQEHREKLVETELEVDTEETAQPGPMGNAIAPTPEFELHSNTHIPCSKWCPLCVQAKRTNPVRHR